MSSFSAANGIETIDVSSATGGARILGDWQDHVLDFSAVKVNGKLTINGEDVTINGLPLVFEHLRKKGLQPGNGCADTLLETVRIYHPIKTNMEAEYREALMTAYRSYCLNS